MAGIKRLVKDKVIQSGETVVAILTGHLFERHRLRCELSQRHSLTCKMKGLKRECKSPEPSRTIQFRLRQRAPRLKRQSKSCNTVDHPPGKAMAPAGKATASGKKSTAKTLAVEVRLPASTSNLGAGFDCFGLALDLYLTVRATIDLKSKLRCRVHIRGGKAQPFSATQHRESDLSIVGLCGLTRSSGFASFTSGRTQRNSREPGAG